MKTLHLKYQAGDAMTIPLKRLRAWLTAMDAPRKVASDLEDRAAKTLTLMSTQAAALSGVGTALNLKQTIEVPPYRVIVQATSARPGLLRRLRGLVTGRK